MSRNTIGFGWSTRRASAIRRSLILLRAPRFLPWFGAGRH